MLGVGIGAYLISKELYIVNSEVCLKAYSYIAWCVHLVSNPCVDCGGCHHGRSNYMADEEGRKARC